MKTAAEKLSAARDYIALAWLVFVLSPTKMPIANCERCRAEHTTPDQMEACDCLTCHGFYAGTLDVARVEEMLRLHPHGLLATRTGASSGTAVVDVDAPHGLPAMRQLIAGGLLPRTTVQRTGGGGYQMVYKHPGTGTRIVSGAGKGGCGVDIKADDAYVVVAPSVHPRTRQRYRWIGSFSGELTPLPEYWVERLREPSRPARSSTVPARAVTGTRYALGALHRQLTDLLQALEGTRNDMLNKSAFAMGQLVGAGMLDEDSTAAVLEDAGQRIGLDVGEVRRSVTSGLRAGARFPRAGCP
jgi:Bifunctional DNA primase/polymerase, N-terminal